MASTNQGRADLSAEAWLIHGDGADPSSAFPHKHSWGRRAILAAPGDAFQRACRSAWQLGGRPAQEPPAAANSTRREWLEQEMPVGKDRVAPLHTVADLVFSKSARPAFPLPGSTEVFFSSGLSDVRERGFATPAKKLKFQARARSRARPLRRIFTMFEKAGGRFYQDFQPDCSAPQT